MAAPFQPQKPMRDRHAKRVTVAKYVLAALLSALTAAGLVSANHEQAPQAARPGGAQEGPVMTRPRYHGVDGRGRPFNVYAERALWRKEGTVGLDNIRADAADGEGSKADMQADEGEYDHGKGMLRLKGDVYLEAASPDKSVNLATREVLVNLRDMTAEGSEEVRAVGDAFTLRADRFRIDGGQGRAVFEGGVVVTVAPEMLASQQESVSEERPEKTHE